MDKSKEEVMADKQTVNTIIDNLLEEAVQLAITEWAHQEYPNDAVFYDVTVKQAKAQLSQLLIKERLDELNRFDPTDSHPYIQKRRANLNNQIKGRT